MKDLIILTEDIGSYFFDAKVTLKKNLKFYLLDMNTYKIVKSKMGNKYVLFFSNAFRYLFLSTVYGFECCLQ